MTLIEADASALQLITEGIYMENGVMHMIIAEMFSPEPGSQEPVEKDYVITIDGDNVSSYAITAP